MKIKWWPWGILTAISLALLLFFVLYPLAVLFSNSVTGQDGGFSLEGFRALLADSQYLEAFGNTLVLGLVVTTCTILVGVPFAYMVARYDFPLKNLVAILPVLTIVIPEIIVGQSWLLVLGNNGILTNLLGDAGISLPSFYGWTGMVFSMTLVYYTYIYLGVLAALRGFDGQLEEAGLSLGTPPLMTQLRVLVPVLLPAVLVNALVVFTLVVGNFALAMLLGSRVPLLSVMTYNTFVSEMGGSPTLQSAMSVVSIAIVAIVLFVQKRVVERKVYTMTQGRAPAARRVRSWQAMLYTGGVGLVILLSLLPLIVVFIAAFTKTSGPVMHWGSWSLASMQRALHGAPEPILNSLKFASLATVTGVAFAVLVSYLTIKKRSAFTQVLDYIVVLPLTISGTVLGIALVQTFNTGWLVLAGTSGIMVLCYAVRRLPFAVRNASSVLFNIPDSIEEASISLGVSPLMTFFKVILPAMKASIISAAILMWLTTISELSASIVAYSGGLETMPIAIFRQVDGGRLGMASAYGAALVTVIVLPIIVSVKAFRIKLFSGK
ncbi:MULTISPECIES: ABC transporter permease [Achromobacter]|jgi:iron(III) transport system permease protein|uniref:Iron ABC transporter permease n=2 Tax=Achromobacter TaxID=222 RepID=A0A0D6HIK3_ALCXX|nr:MULTISPECIES: iron ABC transporter permease [Achromobacter]AHC47122.1 Ferric iron ABC transporter, permease protein [Achromobacter xylosoxidans NBRC 15126 = ATCC 27061]AMG35457.1 iron ABC transporter permease [Achromobacter xylosoxidans]AMH07000.1 iron ABC transporter permease [Achromobacter xylosoxidans]EFV83605.1 binding-protein-dependent transport system inner membrane component [Achromobacter xylosoxidans C54]KWU21310.1 iron ABC transporter permease [Achromobacter xylosoxidans]